MLNKVTFSSKDQNLYFPQGLNVAGLTAIGAGGGLAYSVLSKDKFNKEKENIITKHFNDIEEEIQEYVKYRKKQLNPLSNDEIADLRKEYMTDDYYKKLLDESLDKLKKKVAKHKMLSVGIGLIAGGLIGSVWVLVNKRKNKNNTVSNATGTNVDSNMQSSTKLAVLSHNTSDTNKKDNNKSIKNIVSLIKSSLAGTTAGTLYYLIFNQTNLNKEKKTVLAKYNEIIEKQLKKHIDNALKIDNEVMSERDIESARTSIKKRQQKNIDAELTILKNKAKQCIKKNIGVGLLVGAVIGGIYMLFPIFEKNEK